MSYERTSGGMGWSEPSGRDGTVSPGSCTQVSGGHLKCFTLSQADLACSRQAGCVTTDRTCWTRSGGAGKAYCCPPGWPTATSCANPGVGAAASTAFACRTSAPYTAYPVVRAAQSIVQAAGHNPGAVDGKLGPNTAAAIRGYGVSVGDTVARGMLGAPVYNCAMAFPARTGTGPGNGTQTPGGDTPGSVFDTAASWQATFRAYATNPLAWLIAGAGVTGVLLLREYYKKRPRRLKGQIKHERLKRPIPRTQVKHGRGFRELEERL